MNDLESIKRKIAALLAKANNTAATEAEAEAFNTKAHELMAKYNIARAELEKSEEAKRNHVTLTVQLRPWSSYVLAGICKLYYCRYFSRQVGRQHEITIVGEEQNVAVAHAIAVMVLRSIQTAARQSGDGRSFMTGAGITVYRRCEEMYSHAHHPKISQETPQQAVGEANSLVVLSRREDDDNQKYIADLVGPLRQRRSTGAKVSSLDGFTRGQAHGKTVQLRRNLLG